MALGIMMLFWALWILIGITRTDWQWDPPTIFGFVYVTMLLFGWVAFFIRGRKPRAKAKTNLWSS